MKLNHLTDQCLLSETQRLVGREREPLAVILHHLREIERRRLFEGHASLYEYARMVLGYSEDQAYRRVSATRLMTQLPVVERKIQEGTVTLTHIGLAQAYFNPGKKSGKPMTAKAKLEVIDAVAGKSTREAQSVIRSLGEAAPRTRDSVRALGDQRNLVTAELSDDILAKLEKLRGLLAHTHPNASMSDLVGLACDVALQELSPSREPVRKRAAPTRASVVRAVWHRDQGACVKCKGTHALEVDHITPKSLGGGTPTENLRLLCRTCNQREAIEKLGLGKMEPYLLRPS